MVVNCSPQSESSQTKIESQSTRILGPEKGEPYTHIYTYTIINWSQQSDNDESHVRHIPAISTPNELLQSDDSIRMHGMSGSRPSSPPQVYNRSTTTTTTTTAIYTRQRGTHSRNTTKKILLDHAGPTNKARASIPQSISSIQRSVNAYKNISKLYSRY